jgi:NADH-quinone oxidoreductase subunit N
MDSYDFYIYLFTILLKISILFKLGAVPLHLWAPDLYNATHLNITMWLMLLPKFGLLIFLYFCIQFNFILILSFIGLTGILSIIVGSLALNAQYSFKRFLAYSGISHLGFLLLAFFSLDYSSFFYYLIIYSFSLLNIFLILLFFQFKLGFEIITISDLAGLYSSNNYLGLAFIISIFSLMGIPPLAGFYAKFFILSSYLKFSFVLTLIAIIFSAISCAQYLTLIRFSLFILSPLSSFSSSSFSLSSSSSYLISSFSSFLLFLFLNPLDLINFFTLFL